MSKRLGKKCPRVGVRVAHASLGSGTVTRVETARGKRACVGDLVYVRFADDRVVAVAKSDVTKGKASKLGDVWRLRQQGKDAPDSGRVLEVHPGDYLVNDGTSLEPFRLPQYATGKQLVTKLDDEWANQQRASIRARAQKAPHVRRYFEEHPEEAGALFGLGAQAKGSWDPRPKSLNDAFIIRGKLTGSTKRQSGSWHEDRTIPAVDVEFAVKVLPNPNVGRALVYFWPMQPTGEAAWAAWYVRAFKRGEVFVEVMDTLRMWLASTNPQRGFRLTHPQKAEVGNKFPQPMVHWFTPAHGEEQRLSVWLDEVEQTTGLRGLSAPPGAEEAARGNQWSIRGHLFYAWGLKPMGPKLSPSAYDRWGIAQGSPGTWELTFDMRRPGEVVVLGHSYEGGRSSGDPTYFTSSTRDAGGNLRVSTVADVVQALAVDGLFSLRGVFWRGRDEPELLLTTTFSREQREALLVWLDGAQSRGSSLAGLGDVNQRRVDSTDLPNAFVSTVWEPVDGRFETKVFPMRNGTVEWTGIDWASAKTFEEARKNHRAMVLRWQSREIDPATFGNMSWFPKPGRDALDPQNRVVYIVSINGNMATVKLAGPYGAHVQLPVSSLRSPE